MDRYVILQRLVSIRNNAQVRVSRESKMLQSSNEYELKAFILEKGIEQLIMEIQNTILADSMLMQAATASENRDIA